MDTISVRFDATLKQLVFADGEAADLNNNYDMLLVDEDAVRDAVLNDLRVAMAAFVEVDKHARVLGIKGEDVRIDEPFPGGDVLLVCDGDYVVAHVVTNIIMYVDEHLESALPGLLAPAMLRWEATFLGLSESLDGYVGVEFRLDDEHRGAGALLAAATEVGALASALVRGPLTAATARDLVATGHAKALGGLSEGAWIDVKRQPYALVSGRAGNAAAWEMAKDVAAFANAGGGLIVIPGRERAEGQRQVIDGIGELPLADVNLQRMRDLLAKHVYPIVEGLEVDVVETAEGRGVLWIHIPEQPEQRKPFLVQGALDGDHVVTTHVSIPRRVGADTWHSPIAEIHAQLVAGRGRQLGREEILEFVRRDQLPWGFRELVDGAEAAGILVDVGYGAIRFTTSDGSVFETQYDQTPSKMQDYEVSKLCGALAPYGLEVGRAKTGQLLPRRLT